MSDHFDNKLNRKLESDAAETGRSVSSVRRIELIGLDLALFIDADNQRLLRWIEIEADDIAHLLDELRIG